MIGIDIKNQIIGCTLLLLHHSIADAVIEEQQRVLVPHTCLKVASHGLGLAEIQHREIEFVHRIIERKRTAEIAVFGLLQRYLRLINLRFHRYFSSRLNGRLEITRYIYRAVDFGRIIGAVFLRIGANSKCQQACNI